MAAETKQIAIRLPLDLVAFLEAEARKGERTVAWVARKILLERMQAAQAKKRKTP